MEEQGIDFTLAFRHLRDAAAPGGEGGFVALFPRPEAVRGWLESWRAALAESSISPANAASEMGTANPVVIPRNHRIEEVIAAARERDFGPFHRLHEALSRPYEAREETTHYERPPLRHEEVRATFCGT
jgi:uncharacterized protein YdiU (UPF0061 family)